MAEGGLRQTDGPGVDGDRGAVDQARDLLCCRDGESEERGTNKTALMCATEKGHVHCLKSLVDGGPDYINVQDEDGNTALMIACEKGYMACLQVLLQAGGSVTFQDGFRRKTALLLASENGHCDCVRLVLGAGAEVHYRDAAEMTALSYAGWKGHSNVVRALLTAMKETGADVNSPDREDTTTLMYACKSGNLDCVRQLMEAGADVHRTDKDNMTALMYACGEGDFNSVCEVLQAQPNVNAQNRNGWTALMFSCRDGAYDSALKLLQSSADVLLKDRRGESALLKAMNRGHHKCARLLFANGSSIADIKEANKDGASSIADVGEFVNDQSVDALKYLEKLKDIRNRRRSAVTEGSTEESLFQVALNFLGDTGVGKSSCLKSLLNGMQPTLVLPDDRTVGTDVKQVVHRDVVFHVYDFAGHNSYFSFHQIYLTPFAINVVFIRFRPENLSPFDDCREQLRRWVQLIVAKVPSAVFLIVLSQCDRLSEDQERQVRAVLNNEMEELSQAERLGNTSALLAGSHKKHSSKNEDGHDQPVFCLGIVSMSCKREGDETGFVELLDRCVSLVKDRRLEDRFFRLADFSLPWEKFLDELRARRTPGCFSLTMNEVRRIARAAGLADDDECDICLFLFKVTGDILHYQPTRLSVNEPIFHDPDRLLRLLGQIVHHIQEELLKPYSSRNMKDTSEGHEIMRRFNAEGRIPLPFLLRRLERAIGNDDPEVEVTSRREVSKSVMALAERIRLCIITENSEVFIPSLVTRPRSDIEEELKIQWPKVLPVGCEEFEFFLEMQWPELPIGFFHQLAIALASFSTASINWENGCFCKGSECPLLVEHVQAEPFARISFKVRVQASKREDAALEMTWCFGACQQALSSFRGVKADAVVPCKRPKCKGTFPLKLLVKPYEVLEAKHICSSCPMLDPRSAAEVLPVTKPRGKTETGRAQQNPGPSVTQLQDIKLQVWCGDQLKVDELKRLQLYLMGLGYIQRSTADSVPHLMTIWQELSSRGTIRPGEVYSVLVEAINGSGLVGLAKELQERIGLSFPNADVGRII